ncbi:MAG: hypothetical protein OEW67_03110, partial [Cyclobacteriaceae bacterium]|nr:hypothetical protein [Cyclobacteriaceae bacterium]
MKNKFWFICLLSISLSCNDEKDLAPSSSDGYIKIFTGNGSDFGEVIKTLDDGFIILGNTTYGDGSIQTKLIRLDINGNTLWTKYYGGADVDNNNLQGKSIAVLSNNEGYIVIGDRINTTTNIDSTSMYLFKVDGNGDSFTGIDITPIELSDGVNDYIGDTHGVDVFITTNNTVLTLTQMDASVSSTEAVLISERKIADFSIIDGCTPKFKQLTGVNLIKSLYQQPNSFVTNAGANNDGNANVINLDNNCTGQIGASLIDNGLNGTSVANQIIPTGNNFAIVGTINDDIYFQEVSNDGNTIRTKIYSEELNGIEEGFSICTTSDGGYLIVGCTRITSGSENEIANEVDIVAIKIDWLGNIITTNKLDDELWIKKFGNTNEETAVYVQQTNDGGYAI